MEQNPRRKLWPGGQGRGRQGRGKEGGRREHTNEVESSGRRTSTAPFKGKRDLVLPGKSITGGSQSKTGRFVKGVSQPPTSESDCKERQIRRNKFGYKRLEELSNNPNDNEIILTITNNFSDFKDLLKSKPRPDIVILIMKIAKKILSTDFSSAKIRVLISLCQLDFMDHFTVFITQMEINKDKVKYLEFFDCVCSFFECIIEQLPSTAVECLLSVVRLCSMFLKGFSTEFSDASNRVENCNLRLEMMKEERLKRPSKSAKEEILYYEPPPNDFRTLSVFPTPEALQEQPFLRANITQGSYLDSEHYLDIQFRLLREDFFEPLRQGLTQYRESLIANKPKQINHHIKIYRNVTYIEDVINFQHPEEISVKLQFDPKFAKRIKWEYSKRFLFGSLLLLTNDQFNSYILATVRDRDVKKLSEGFINVSLIGNVKQAKSLLEKSEFIMAESSAFFEPYFQILNAIKSIPSNHLPMEKYLLVKNPSLSHPLYIESSDYVQFGSKTFSILLDTWPTSAECGLNYSQYAAFKAALTNEFVVIQGPPGTGKTYVGLKIVEFLLKNFDSLSISTPIVLVCYTNHALDQFLEGLIPFTSEIIRIGGQSKNEALKNFNYNMLRKSHTKQYYECVDKLKSVANKVIHFNEMIAIINKKKNIIDFSSNDFFFYSLPECLQLNTSDFVQWLIDDPHANDLLNKYEKFLSTPQVLSTNTVENNLTLQDEDDDDINKIRQNEYSRDFIDIGPVDNTSNMKNCAINLNNLELLLFVLKKELKKLEYFLMTLDDDIDNDYIQKQICLTLEINKIEYVINVIKDKLASPLNLIMKVESIIKRNIWSLNLDDRWAIYFYFLNKYKIFCNLELSKLQLEHQTIVEEIKELRLMEIYSVINKENPKIVGLTTTGAAKHHTLLDALKSKIVIVEEAAEVLEAHVVVSLNKHCQHVVLIGDHKQLKPNPSTFLLAKKYKLDISLFERMLLNGLSCHSLNIQHRMRPSIASLISPTIYDNLQNHDSVNSYPEILGVKKSLFFINHSVHEKTDEDLQSHLNIHEAEFLIALCRYLILQNYNPEDITILTTYSAQQFHLRSLKKANPLLKDVRVTVIDNYQGEENKIILLSLVRSNEEGKIGFLATENRICVALSRAKHGLYIIGNMSILTAKSEMWTKIQDVLQNMNAIGPSLQLECQIHKSITSVVDKNDFNQVQEGGCNLTCNRQMLCGHNCLILCHTYDAEHAKTKCFQTCTRAICPEVDHVCPLKCYENCAPCKVLMERSLPCGHKILLQCHVDINTYKCLELVPDKKPDCGHDVIRACYLSIDEAKCTTPCPYRLDCGHSCTLKCHVNVDPDHNEYKCMKECVKLNLNCSKNHSCKKRCFEECGSCMEQVQKKKSCGHMFKKPCYIDIESFDCQKPCERNILSCGHKCKKKCFEVPCGNCAVEVEKIIVECGHSIKVKCSVTPNRSMCNKPCTRKLKCGHDCLLRCKADCDKSVCREIIQCPVNQACGHPATLACYKRSKVIDSFSDELLQYCREPCGKLLPCGDICKGTCGLCMQGRIHQVCKEKCGNTLVCGHECKVPCREDCPPCKEKCFYKCEHSRCNKPCGKPCKPCAEPCSWRCAHSECTKKCGELCNKEPCSEPCQEKLACGHDCVGFCGDTCPPLCRICNNEELTEIFFGSEADEDARYIYLNDCEHTLESTSLQQFLNRENEESNKEIRLKRCPKCNQPILTTKRFGNVIKLTFRDIAAVRNKIFGNEKALNKLKSELLSRMRNITKLINEVPPFVGYNKNILSLISTTTDMLNAKGKRFMPGQTEWKLINYNVVFLNNLLSESKRLQGNTFKLVNKVTAQRHLKEKLETRINLLLRHLSSRKMKINSFEIKQFDAELDRLSSIIDLNIILGENKSLSYSASQEILLNKLNLALFSINVFGYDEKRAVLKLLVEVKDSLKVRWEPVTAEEKRQIHAAMSINFNSPSKQGHWFTCSKGHIYVITECGGAMEEGMCPECKEVIGGANHSLRSTSRLTSEMDGARYAAWSEQQNMANFRF